MSCTPQVQSYREAMHRVYRAFHWDPKYGGQAYELTLQSLLLKLQVLWGTANITSSTGL